MNAHDSIAVRFFLSPSLILGKTDTLVADMDLKKKKWIYRVEL